MSEVPHEVVILNDHAYVNGGTGAVAIASALELAERGVFVTFFSCVGPVASELRNVMNLRVICLGEQEIAREGNRLRAIVSGIRNTRAAAVLDAELAGHAPGRTIVHVHSWTKALSPLALAAVLRRGVPLVVTLHDFFISCPSGGFYDHGRGEICQRVPLSGSCWGCRCDRRNYAHKLWRCARTVYQNRVLRIPGSIAHFVGVSRFSLERLRPFLPSHVPASLVRNPISVERQPAVDVSRNRRYVFAGRLEEEKGARLFAEAVRRAGVPATFIGDGALAQELRMLCPDARFTGWLDAGRMREELAQARALVFPSRWYETLGLVVIEAAAQGVPAIVADRCAATDHVVEGVTGRHFRHGSVESLAQVIRETAEDDRQIAWLGQEAYGRYWRDPWTRQRHGDELLRLYDEIRAARDDHSRAASGAPAGVSGELAMG